MRTPASLLLLLVLSACTDGGARGGEILIGWGGPANLADGQASVRGATMAINEINRAGGINGRQLRLIPLDDDARAEQAVVVAGALKDSGVVAVVGHLYSSATLGAAPVYNDPADPVALISPSSTAPAVSQAGEAIFRVCPSDVQYAAAVAEFAVERLDARRALLLYANNAYGRGFRRAFADAYAGHGGQVVSEDPYLADDVRITAYVERMQRRQPADVIILVAGGEEEAVAGITQIRALAPRLPIIGGDGLDGVQEHGAIGEGAYLVTAWLASVPGPRIGGFLQAYREAHPGAPAADQQVAAGYDIVHLIATAIRDAGTDRRAIINRLAQTGRRAPAFEGVLGTTAFDEHGDIVGRDGHIAVVRAGALLVAN